MHARFLLIPAAALSIGQPADAKVYLTVRQAQDLMFPGATLTPEFRTLTREQIAAIEKASGAKVLNRELKVWKVSTGDWFIADEVLGKHEYIPFALSIDSGGSVKDVEILEYREAYGGDVMNSKWRAQFSGKNRSSPVKLTQDIQNISGATLSSKHITDGVRRLLITHAIVFADH